MYYQNWYISTTTAMDYFSFIFWIVGFTLYLALEFQIEDGPEILAYLFPNYHDKSGEPGVQMRLAKKDIVTAPEL